MEQERVAQYINQKRLFMPTDKVIIALSGGADSVALLCLLQTLGYNCEAAHCNFHLRGKESDRDEAFVCQLCAKRQVPLHIVHFNTVRTAEERHISIEMAARELRYEWFEEIRRKSGANVIAVAHHRDDSVETLLLNLIRGTGINGLRGIRPKNGHIVRPLLCLDRKEIINYLNRTGQDYVTDSTNLQDEYTRNKIRLNLLPMMQEINPSVKESILNTAEHLASSTSTGIECPWFALIKVLSSLNEYRCLLSVLTISSSIFISNGLVLLIPDINSDTSAQPCSSSLIPIVSGLCRKMRLKNLLVSVNPIVFPLKFSFAVSCKADNTHCCVFTLCSTLSHTRTF